MKKILAISLAVVLMLSLIPSVGLAAVFDSDNGHWALDSLAACDKMGLLDGLAEESYAIDDKATRGDMFQIMDNIMKYPEAEGRTFTDLDETHPYYDTLNNLNAHGIVNGYPDDTIRPDNPVSREEAMVIFARVFSVESDENAAYLFSDGNTLGDWSRGLIGGMKALGYIEGYEDESFRPSTNISFAELFKMIDNMLAGVVNKAGTYTEDFGAGYTVVNVTGATLKDLTVEGDLIAAAGIGKGDLMLDGVKVGGRLIVNGGGVNSITIKGNSTVGTVIVYVLDGQVSIRIEGGAEVEVIYVSDGCDGVFISGTVGNLVIGDDVSVTLNSGAKAANITITGDGAALAIASGATVTLLDVQGDGDKIVVSGTLTDGTVSGSNSDISGTGKITGTVTYTGGEDNTITVVGTKIEVGEGAGAVKAGNATVEPGEDATIPGGTTTGGGGYVGPVGPTVDPSPLFDPAESFIDDYSIEYSESGFADAVEYEAYQAVYVNNPVSGSEEYQTMNIKVPTSIRGVAYDASESPILFINGASGYDAADVPDTDGFDVSTDYARRALWEGWIIVEAGNRSGEEGLADLKAAVRFLRYNTNSTTIPGNKNLIFALGGDYALLLGSKAGNANEAVFCAASYNPTPDQTNKTLTTALFNKYVVPSALKHLQKVFANDGYSDVASASLPSGATVTYNNGNAAANATNVTGVTFTQANFETWAGSQPAGTAPNAALIYGAGGSNLAPNWWVRSGVKSAFGNAAFLALAEDLEVKPAVKQVSCGLVWDGTDGSSDVNGFFNFAHYILAYTENRTVGVYTGLEDTPIVGDTAHQIPGTSPAEYYNHYDPILENVNYTVKADIPYVAYEAVPVPYEAQTGLASGVADGYYQRLDIYRKQGTEAEVQPVMVYVHGGANVAGDKAGPTSTDRRDTPSRDQMIARSGMKYGYTVVEVNYRLQAGGLGRAGIPVPGRPGQTDRAAAPAGLVDVRAAVRWIKENAEMLNIDPDNIIIAGASAGGEKINQAALYGTNPGKYDTHNSLFAALGASEINDNVAAIISIMSTTVSATVITPGLISAYVPPTYIVTGERDSICNWRTNSLLLYNALLAAGNTDVRMDIIEGAGHELAPQHFADVFNTETLYYWLNDLHGFSNVLVNTITGPENIALSFPDVYETLPSSGAAVLTGLTATDGKELNDNPGLVLTIDVTGTLDNEDNIFTGDAADDFADLLDAEATPIIPSSLTYISITNMADLLAAVGIKDNQKFTIRQANPALNAAYGPDTFPSAGKDKTYAFSDLATSGAYNILLLPGESTVTITILEGATATGNARLTIKITSNFTFAE